MPEVAPSALANAVMSKLYDVLTNGDETVPKSEDNFFTWCTPGIPLDPSETQFMVQGLTGVVKRQDAPAPAPGAAPPQPLSPADLERLRAQDASGMYQQAEGFARLVDFVPDVTAVNNEQFARLNVMNDQGTLSDLYAMTLRLSQVMHQDLEPDKKAKIEKFRALLNVTTKKKNLIDDTEIEVSEPSPLVVAYHEKMQAYVNAALEYNNHRIDAMVADDPRAVHDWAINANLYREKVKAAMKDWETSGYKADYEAIAAFIEQVQARDLAILKAEYEDALQKALLTGLNSGSDFYYTSVVPGNFASAAGWSRFQFGRGDFSSRSSQSASASSWNAGGGAAYFGIFGGKANHRASEDHSEFHGTFDSDTFTLDFEICQVPIVRPWFKNAFLVSRAWRFDPTSPDVKGRLLSDGGAPPKGLLPAYPTTMVLVRNLTLRLGQSSGFSDYIEQHKSSETSGGGYVAFGPIFLGGSAGSVASSGSKTRDWGYKYDDQGLQVPGMQVVGFKCHLLPKCPDPEPAIQSWI